MACAKWGHQLAAMTLPTWLALYFGKHGNDVLLCCALHDRIVSHQWKKHTIIAIYWSYLPTSNWHWHLELCHETKNELVNRETMWKNLKLAFLGLNDCRMWGTVRPWRLEWRCQESLKRSLCDLRMACGLWKDQSGKKVQLESWNWTFFGSFYESFACIWMHVDLWKSGPLICFSAVCTNHRSSGPGLWSLCPCALEGCQKSSRCQHFSHRLSSLASRGACSNHLINLTIQTPADVDTSVQVTVVPIVTTSVFGLWGHRKLCAVSSWTARLSAWTWCRERTSGSTCRQAPVSKFFAEWIEWIVQVCGFFLRRKGYETNFTWIYSESDAFRFSKSSAACSTAWFAFTSFGRGLYRLCKVCNIFLRKHLERATSCYGQFGTWSETNLARITQGFCYQGVS